MRWYRQKQAYEEAACLSYVMGFVDMAQRPTGMLETAACIPKGATYGQAMDVLLAHLKDRPAERHKPTAQLLWDAWAVAFPCRSR